MAKNPVTRPIGLVLTKAGLISPAQLQVSLQNQQSFTHLRLGEIIALHGWIKQQTADFFAEKWPKLAIQPQSFPIGTYFKQAGLLTPEQIEELLYSQKKGQTWIRFGGLAVFAGYLKQETVDFFFDSWKQAATSRQYPEIITDEDEADDDEIPWAD